LHFKFSPRNKISLYFISFIGSSTPHENVLKYSYITYNKRTRALAKQLMQKELRPLSHWNFIKLGPMSNTAPYDALGFNNESYLMYRTSPVSEINWFFYWPVNRLMLSVNGNHK